MSEPEIDEYEALRRVVQTLEAFNSEDRKQIMKWASEKLGIAEAPSSKPVSPEQPDSPHQVATDLRTFYEEKNPRSDIQFAVVVAYYYQFEALNDRRENIKAQDLNDAARIVGRSRLTRPDQTLVNAFNAGFFDKNGTGNYRINAVGENLVAMVLPDGANGTEKPKKVRRKSPSKKKTGSARRKKKR